MIQKLFLPLLLGLTLWANGQTVNIPDANFKNALLNTDCVFTDEEFTSSATDADTNNNGEIEVGEALAVQYLKVASNNISSLSGIASFQNLKGLDCSTNQLTSLDVSPLSNLIWLVCDHNMLSSLTLNSFSDSLFGTLVCSNNMLTSLALPGSNYEFFMCDHNQITSLSFTDNAFIYESSFSDNDLTAFQVTPMVHFSYLDLTNNPLTEFGLAAHSSFEYLILNNTSLGFLDLGNLDVCDYLSIKNNQSLTAINLVNANFEGRMDTFLYIYGNPVLNHVCVNDYSNIDPEQNETSEFGNVSQEVGPSVAVTYYCSFTPNGDYNTVSGLVHYGCTGPGTALQSIRLNVNGPGGSGYTYSNVQGAYTFYTGTGSYSITPALEHPQYFNVDPASYNPVFSTGSTTESADFCLTANGVHRDLTVSIIPVIPARPGFDAVYKIVYENRGTESQAGTVSLTFEDALTDLVFSSPPLSGMTSNTLSWSFSGLDPFEKGEIMVRLNVNGPTEIPAVHNGDVLHFTAAVISDVDETPADNTFVMDQHVVGSFDPNDKFVSDEAIEPGEADRYLYYTVRFQNTGTDVAENIVVRDKLSDKLDLSTLQMVSASHNCRTTLSGSKLEYFFQGINLPAMAVNEALSHGYVTYRIRPKAGISGGDVILNTADIFFDYNAAVVTNTVTTTVSQLGVATFDAQDIAIYPNPTQQTVTIDSGNSYLKNILIYNYLGQIVKSAKQNFSLPSVTVDISDLSAGTYLIKIVSDRGSATRKLIKL